MTRHWKIRNLENRKAYYVPVKQIFGVTVLDQLVMFLREHKIRTDKCRIIESSTRTLNVSFEEYVVQQLTKG